MNKKFVYQVGNIKMLYYDARPTKYEEEISSLINWIKFGIVIDAFGNRFLNGLYQVVRFTGNYHVMFACFSHSRIHRFLHNVVLMVC